MARPIPAQPELSRNGIKGDRVPRSRLADLGLERVGADEVTAAALDSWSDGPDAATLQRDNEQLRQQAEELERLLGELKQEAEQALAEQQREFESILEEKTEAIRELHRRLQEAHDQPAPAGHHQAANVPADEELMALSEELERERQQLKDDEEAMMQQMGHMEVQMSKERAEMARQRTELVRLQSEIRHELELAARDAALRERLAPLQRRSQDLARSVSSGGTSSREVPPVAPPASSAPTAGQAPSESGLFRRIFG